MESAAQGAPAGIRSLVIPQSALRLVIRGGRAVYSPLDSRAPSLLQSLERRLDEVSVRNGALHAWFPAEPGDPGVPDGERLRRPSVLDAIRVLAGLVEDEERGDVAPAGLYGAFSYELVDHWEELPPRRPDRLNEPDASFVYALDAVHFDHLRGEVRVVTRSLGTSDGPESEERHRMFIQLLQSKMDPTETSPRSGEIEEKETQPDVTDQEYMASVRRFLSHIHAGDIFQGVISRGLAMPSRGSTLAVYRMLREQNPSPYMFHLDLGDGALLGASPETCLKVDGKHVEIRPIAGTAPRGLQKDGCLDEDMDGRLAVGLILDDKEQAEHVMLVDLARNDVARVSVPGTRRVTDPFSLEKYSHVQHLVSRVRGTLRPELDALHAYRASANMGTLTGAPKLRAMELIRENEPFSRGFYGGAVGYLLQDGTFDSCIVIRSLRYRNGVYTTRTGAGIVADSIPERELEETMHKARACRLAVAAAERCES
jgi:anthranilate synthase component 1